MATQQDVIKTFMKSLDDTTQDTAKVAVDEAFNTASNTRFRNMLELTEAFLNDYNSYPKWEDFLREKCGIILDNEDSGSITGLDTGGTKIKTDESIIPENGTAIKLDNEYRDSKGKSFRDVTISGGVLSFTRKGLTVKVPSYDKLVKSADGGNSEAQRKLTVINGLYTWWIENSLQLIEDSYGANFGFTNESSAATKEIEVNLDRTDTNSVCGTEFSNGKLSLYVYMNCFPDITETDTEGKSPVTGEHLDHTIAHEMTHAVMDVNIKRYLQIDWDSFSYNYNLPVLISEGIAELTRGIDKYRSSSITQALSSEEIMSTVLSNPYRTNYFKNKDGSQDNTNTTGQYTIGYMLLRYLAKQCATEEAPVTSLGANQSITCTLEEGMLVKANNGTAVLQKGDALVTDGYGNIATIKIGNENNIISTPESKTMVVVKDHNNNDIATIFGSASVHDSGLVYKNFSDIDVSSELDNVSITGGNGNDVVFVKAKNSNIVSKDGNDKITINGDSAYINSGDGNNVVFIKGDKNTIDSNGGIDTITVDGNNNKLYGGDGADDADKFIIVTQVKNNTIENFQDGYDELWFETDDITAKVKTLNETNSVVISSAKTGDTLVVLEDVTSGSNDNIIYSTGDGSTVRTSIDWLLANTNPINPDPDNPGETETQTINVQPNGNVNNTRNNVIINAVSGNNVIQNSGSNVRITGGTDKDEVSNNANNVTIDGKAGNDVLSNGSAGSFPITHVRESFNGGDSVILNGGLGADLIYNYLGVNVELRGGEDNDTINNTGNNVQITGDNGNDAINNNGGDMVTIDGGDGKDTLFSSGKVVSIFGGNGEDSIRINASGANATVNGGNDDDNISNYGSNALIDGGSGNDYLYNRGTDSTINGGMGNDSISNPEGSRVLLYGDEDNDEIRNGAENVTIDGGSGDDSIDNNAANVSIFGGDGKDTITHRNGQANNVMIDAGAGDDSISNLVASNILINGGDGNDSINNRGNNVTINSGSGNDSIVNNGERVTIEGAEGDDTITNSRKEVSMNGGSGADFIDNGHDASNVTIDGGKDNDTIANESSSVKIVGDSGNDSIYNKDNNYVTIDSGSDDDLITNSTGLNASINAGAGNDYIDNDDSDSVTINTGEGKDSILNSGDKNIIFGETGEDVIYNYGDDTTINGGADNDSIYNGSFTTSGTLYNLENGALLGVAYNISLIGGDGDDYIANTAGYVTLEGCAGNDKIRLVDDSGTWIKYTEGDGSDTIWGFNENTWLKIGDGTGTYSNSIVNNNIVIKVGDGSIILIDAKGINPKIQGKQSYDTTPADTTPADTTPADTTPADTTPADTTPADTTPSGQDQVAPVQIIRNLTGIDINRLEKVIVTDTDSLDDIIAERTVWLNFSTDSSKGVQNVDLSKSPYRQVVSIEGGNQKVQFSDENGNVAIVDASATGSKNIIFGNGDDLGIFYSSDANIRATVGSGRDSIITDNNAHVRVDMTSSEGTKIIPYSGRIILDNYAPDSRAEIIIPDVTDITSAIKDNSIQLIGNEVRPNSSTRIQLNGSTNANIVNLSTEHGDTQKVGFTGINGGAVDAHELRGKFLLKGNYAENASDKQKRKPSTLISGNGHDTILAGARDFVDGGNGRNQIFLTPYDLRQIKDGATIASSGNGRNTVHGFHEGFGYNGDVIQVNDFNNIKFKFDTDGLLLTANDSRIKFDGIGITSATTDDSTNSLGTNRAELIQITNGSSTMRTAVAQTNQSILVQEDDYIIPNAFFGNRSGLNFSEYRGSVEINLADGTGKLGKWDATFKGINKLQAGNGMSTLIGDDTRNTLIAGTGYTSMWGGSGNDKLIGKGNSTDKNGRTTFFFFAGDGRDVISDFTFLTPENRYDGIDDRINVGNSDINDAYRAGNNVVVVFDQNSYLILEDAVGKDFQIANMIAKVDRNIAYDGLANCYVASGGSSLTVDSTVRSAEIWLDNSHGTQFFGNIRTLDASAVEGNTSLVGNEFDDTIIAGQGDSSLWGGFASSNDLLIGGNSRNTFFYCMGNGNDTIQGTNDRDFVILSDVSLDQITETSITDDSVSIRFNDGGSLQIKGTSDVTYQLADGSKYSANHQRLEWDSR